MLDNLPPATKMVFNFYAIEHYSYADIMDELEISYETVKWHLKEARKKLKRNIRELKLNKMSVDNNKEHIDQLFRNGLKNRSFDVPTSFENDLNKSLDALDKKKKRSFSFWLLLLSYVFDVTVVAIILFGNNRSPIYTQTNPVTGIAKVIPDATRINSFDGNEIDDDTVKYSKELAQMKPSHTSTKITPTNSTNKMTNVSAPSLREVKRGNSDQIDKKSSLSAAVKSRDVEKADNSQNKRSTKFENTRILEAKTKKKKNQSNRSSQLKMNRLESKSNQNKGLGTSKNDLTASKKDKQAGNRRHEAIQDDNQSAVPSKAEKGNKKTTTTSSAKGETQKTDLADMGTTPSTIDSEGTSRKEVAKDKNKELKSVVKKQANGMDNQVAPATSPKEENHNAVKSKNNSQIQGKNSNSNWKMEIQLYAGFGSTFIHSSSDEKGYLDNIDKNRKPLNTPTIGVNGNISYKKLTLGLGLSYLQTGERYSTKIDKVTSQDISYLTFDSTTEVISYYQPYGTLIGDTTRITVDTVTNTETVLDTTSVLKKIKNRYSWISIPVSFGYRFTFGKYDLTPRVGVQFNFGISGNRGKYPTSDFVDFSTVKATKFNMSYLFNVELKRNFNNWSIFLRPYFKSMINPAINESLLKRKYSSWGLQVGVGFDL